jgi:hypothetical protein
MVEPIRHRQTKEAATDMFYLKPPRHISTLPSLCENSDVELSRRTFVSITSNKKRTALAGTIERRKEGKQFCAFSARARFHTAWVKTGKAQWEGMFSALHPENGHCSMQLNRIIPLGNAAFRVVGVQNWVQSDPPRLSSAGCPSDAVRCSK